MQPPSERRPSRKVAVSLAISLGIVLGVIVLFLLVYPALRDQGADLARPPDGGAADPAASGADEKEDARLVGQPAEAGAETAAEDLVEVPPLLQGTVTGEGAGVADALVLLFSVKSIERGFERIEDILPQGEMPDVAALIADVRAELDRFRKSAITTRTRDDGTYEFRGIEPTGYVVLTVADEWLFRYGDVVSLSKDRTEVLDIDLSRGESIAGRVVGPAGLGLPGVPVLAEFRPPGIPGVGRILRKLLGYINGEFLKGPFERVTAEDGSFRLAGLPPGTYDLHAAPPRGPETTLPGVATGSADAVIWIGEGARIRGYLVDDRGLPLRGIQLMLEREENTLQLPLPAAPFTKLADTIAQLLGDPPMRIVSGAAGVFEASELSPGKYRLRCEHAGFLPLLRNLEVQWSETVDLGAVRLDRGEAIAGVTLDESDRPIEGAKVLIVPQQMGFLNAGTAISDVLTGRLVVASDAGGAFRATGLVRGDYQLIATARGFAPAGARGVRPGGDPVTLRMKPGVRIEGRVLEADGRTPIADARVRAGDTRTRTDSEGKFALDGVAPRDGSLNPFGGMGGGPRPEPTTSVRVQASASGYLDASETIDLVQAGSGVDILLAPAPVIQGKVLDPEGNPIPGGLVRLAPWVPEALPPILDFVGDGTIFLAVSMSDLEGRFRLSGFRGGNPGQLYRVVADHVLHARGFSEPFRLEGKASPDGRPVGVQLVRPGEGGQMGGRGRARGGPPAPGAADAPEQGTDPEGKVPPGTEPVGPAGADVEVRLEKRSRIHGLVTDGSRPVSGAAVRLSRKPETANAEADQGLQFLGMLGLPKGGKIAWTGRDGRFSHDALRGGAYTLDCEVVGFISPPAQTVELAPGDEKELTFTVDPGGEIRGVVVDSTEEAVPDARVRLLLEPGAGDDAGKRMYDAQKFLGGAYRSGRSDAEGRFVLAGLPPGTYTLSADKSGYTRAEVGGLAPGPAEARIVLVRAAAIVGTVADAANGNPITRFAVRVQRTGAEGPEAFLGGFPRDHSDAEGRFARADLEPGTWDVEVSAAGYSTASAKVDLAPAGTSEAHFALERSGTIVGVATDAATGAPIPGVRVEVLEEPPEAGRGETGDRRDASDRRRSRVRRTAEAREARDEGASPANAEEEDQRAIQEYIADTFSGQQVTSRGDGTFLVEDLPQGPVRLVASHAEYIGETRGGLAVGAGQELRVDLRLRGGVSVSGVVLDAAGAPSGGRWVFVRGTGDRAAGARKAVTSEADGRFRIAGLEPGPYRLLVASRSGGDRRTVLEVDVRDHVAGLQVTTLPE